MTLASAAGHGVRLGRAGRRRSAAHPVGTSARPWFISSACAALREAASSADAFLLVSPEYNGTIPAVLKNAIDWLSRPFGAGAFGGKPVAVVGTAFGQYGGIWAQDETRKSAGIAGAKVLEDVKLSIPGSLTRFAETHPADDAEIAAQLTEVVARLHGHVKAAA